MFAVGAENNGGSSIESEIAMLERLNLDEARLCDEVQAACRLKNAGNGGGGTANNKAAKGEGRSPDKKQQRPSCWAIATFDDGNKNSTAVSKTSLSLSSSPLSSSLLAGNGGGSGGGGDQPASSIKGGSVGDGSGGSGDEDGGSGTPGSRKRVFSK